MYPIVGTMEAALRHAPPSLIAADDHAALVELAGQLPDVMSGLGFECRLRTDDPRVDFYGSVHAGAGGRQALADFPVPTTPAPAGEAWQRVGAFAARWADVASPLHAGVATVFLEFDAPFVPPRAPSLFARLALDVGDGEQQWRQGQLLIDEIVRLLLGQQLPAATRAKLRQVFTALPIGGHVVDVAAMLPRGTAAVRVFASIPRHQLSAYLTRLGWVGTDQDLQAAMAILTRGRSHVSLQLDVADELGPRIGLETSGDPDPASQDAWGAVISRATAARLCSVEKQAALAAWLGTTRETLPGARWPCLLHRMLSHVKLVIEPGQPIEAKVYLWVLPQFSMLG